MDLSRPSGEYRGFAGRESNSGCRVARPTESRRWLSEIGGYADERLLYHMAGCNGRSRWLRALVDRETCQS